MTIQLDQVIRRLADKKVELHFAPEARKWLATKGYDPVFGARPLKRVVQSEVLNPLAKELIGGKIKAGEKIHVELKNDKIAFRSEDVH